MIPFFEFSSISLGPLTIQVWGLLVSLGALLALLIAVKFGKKFTIPKEIILDLFVWGLIGGLIGARIFFIIFYQPLLFIQEPIEIIKIWNGGASSLGAIVGAILSFAIYFKVKKISWKDAVKYLDILAFAFWPGWAIGRIGCFLIHDHIGRLSNFFLAVNFPFGSRHDLGLYESLLALVVFIISLFLYKKWVRFPGRLVIYTFLIYAPIRFLLDFLRADDLLVTDARYAALTPMQWGIIAYLAGLTFWYIYAKITQRKNISGRVA